MRWRRFTMVMPAVVVAAMLVPVPATAAQPSGGGTVTDTSVDVQPLKTADAVPLPKMPPVTAAQVRWPSSGTAMVASNEAAVVGGLPIRVGAPTAVSETASLRTSVSTPGHVRVDVVASEATKRAGVPVVLQVTRADAARTDGRVRLEVDYSAFRYAFGADWDNRLSLVYLPACTVSTPEAAGCSTPTFVPTVNNHKAGVLTAEVDLKVPGSARPVSDRQAALEGVEPGTPSAASTATLAVIAAASSDIGDYTKTSLNPSYSWAAGSQSGDFSFSYPIPVPPVAGPLKPEIALSYSSGTVDGQTVGVNVQPFWGEGWKLHSRLYRAGLPVVSGRSRQLAQVHHHDDRQLLASAERADGAGRQVRRAHLGQ